MQTLWLLTSQIIVFKVVPIVHELSESAVALSIIGIPWKQNGHP